jgi:hypothetical protein
MKPIRRFKECSLSSGNNPLTRKDMYDKDGECILPYGGIAKKYRGGKYVPAEEDKKHDKEDK